MQVLPVNLRQAALPVRVCCGNLFRPLQEILLAASEYLLPEVLQSGRREEVGHGRPELCPRDRKPYRGPTVDHTWSLRA
jgi:hypothetical protein